jgi:putative sterol carrier protein
MLQMEDGATLFLREFGRRYEPLLAKVSGTVRLDLVDDDHIDRWLATIDKGAVRVAHKGGPADCTIRTQRSFFERLARGEENAFAATLRNEVRVTGDIELLLAIQRVFPGPPRAVPPTSSARGQR